MVLMVLNMYFIIIYDMTTKSLACNIISRDVINVNNQSLVSDNDYGDYHYLMIMEPGELTCLDLI